MSTQLGTRLWFRPLQGLNPVLLALLLLVAISKLQLFNTFFFKLVEPSHFLTINGSLVWARAGWYNAISKVSIIMWNFECPNVCSQNQPPTKNALKIHEGYRKFRLRVAANLFPGFDEVKQTLRLNKVLFQLYNSPFRPIQLLWTAKVNVEIITKSAQTSIIDPFIVAHSARARESEEASQSQSKKAR